MKRWKQYLSLMTAAAMVISGPVIPAKQAKAADAQMVTDTDLSDTEVAEPASWGATPNAEQLWYMKQGTAAFCHSDRIHSITLSGEKIMERLLRQSFLP